MELVFLGTNNNAYDWITEANPNRNYANAWVYEKDGQLHWSRGQEGHFIYQKLKDAVEQNIAKWVYEYAIENLEGGK